jgi:putative endonuclease
VIGRILDQLRHLSRKRRWNPDLASGRHGEDLAHRFLKSKGYTIVARNYRLATGDAETDLIAWDRGTLVFVEVKTRASAEFGPPERAFDGEKQRHMLRAARQYAQRRSIPIEQVRFDLVTVVLDDPPLLTLFQGMKACH